MKTIQRTWSSGHAERLALRIEERTAKVAVIGLGYIGLPICAAAVEAGFEVVGVDRDPERVARLEAGETPLEHLGADLVRELRATGRFRATAVTEELAEADVVLLCVPTPLDEERRPDLSAVRRASEAVGRAARPGQLVVLESTSWPGTTREIVGARLQHHQLELGRELFLAFAPEREDPGRSDPPSRAVPRLVGGVDETSGRLAELFYQQVVERVVRVSSAEVAEAAKLLENIYRAVNIAAVNEMKVAFTAMGLDIEEVIDAASTKPFGFQPFRPGPGLGGHCIPVDPFYLAHRAEQVGAPTALIELAGSINRDMPQFVVDRTVGALAEDGVAAMGARVLVLGVAYKPDVDDVRESPSFDLLRRLHRLGAVLSYHDPHVAQVDVPGPGALASAPLDGQLLREVDAVLVATAHRAIDWELVGREASLVIDTRGVFRTEVPARVVRA